MNGIFSNPEIIRNARAQLRPGRMVAIAMICAVLSLAVGFAFLSEKKTQAEERDAGLNFLRMILGWQVGVLALGGALACAQSIQREKQMNTFDFQRVTRLTPWELTLGKLLGAPVITWFIAVCLLPAALWGAVVAHVGPLYLLAAFLVMVVGSLTYHAAGLLLSLHDVRDAGGRILSVLALGVVGIALMGFDANTPGTPVGGRLSPFFALAVVDHQVWDTSWQARCLQVSKNPEYECAAAMRDLFFGRPVNHFVVFLVVNLIFAAWFLLGVARNLKRDPSVYEIFTPAQSLGFALYLNVLLLGFVNWREFKPLEGQMAASVCEIGLFFLLGMMLLRNRDQIRRRLHRLGGRATGWIEAIWPAPYVVAGMALTGFAVIATMARSVGTENDWRVWGRLALFRLAFLTFWLVRDILYLQWMGLRRGRRTRGLALVYWAVYYFTLAILFNTLELYATPKSMAHTAIFVPWPVFNLDAVAWAAAREAWILALAMQVLVAGLFVAMQRRRLLEMGAGAAPMAAPVAGGD